MSAVVSSTLIDSGPSDVTERPAASFTFHASDPDARFTCSLDGADFMPCTSPATYYDLKQGDHLFQLESSGRRAAWKWTVVPPQGSPATASADVSGPCTGDGCFNVTHAMAVDHYLSVDIGIRSPNTPNDTRTQQYLNSAFTGYGLRVQSQPLPLPQGGYSANVIGTTSGDFNAVMNSGRFLIVDAHYDTTPNAPGGNDNGSGTGSLIEIARALQLQPAPLPVIFVGFGAEEIQPGGSSRIGSSYYVNHMTASQRANLVAMINLDMIGHGSNVLLRWIQGTPFEGTKRLQGLGQSMGITTQVVNFATSDETPFANAGLNVGSLRGETPQCYDVPCDTYSTVDPAEVDRAGRMGLAALRSYVDSPPVVSWVSPAAGAQTGSSVTVQVSVTDDGFPGDINPPSATLYLDGVSQGAESGTYIWNLSNLTLGQHTLHVEASDGVNPNVIPPDRTITVTSAPPPAGPPSSLTTGHAESVNGATSVAVGSFTSATSSLYLAGIEARSTVGNAVPTLGTTQCGLQWTEVAHKVVSASSPFKQLTLFKAQGTPTSPCQLKFSFPSTMTNFAWSVAKFDNVGNKAVLQPHSANGKGSTASVTMSPFASSRNATFGITGLGNGNHITANPSFAELSQQASTSSLNTESEWQSSSSTTVSTTFTTANWAIIAVEISAA